MLCCCVLAAITFRPVVFRGSLYLLWAMFGFWPECGAFLLGMLWTACEIRPVSAATVTKASQNSQVRRLLAGIRACLPGRGLAVLEQRQAGWEGPISGVLGLDRAAGGGRVWCKQFR